MSAIENLKHFACFYGRRPAVFVCENNGYAISTPYRAATAIPEVGDRATSYDDQVVLSECGKSWFLSQDLREGILEE